MSEYLEAGKIISLHSFKGEVKIKNFCESAEFFKNLEIVYKNKKDGEELKIKSVHEAGTILIVAFEGIESEEEAAKLKNLTLYFKKESVALSSGFYFVDDLIGLDVFDAVKNEKIGIVKEIFSNGKHDIFVVGQTDKNKKDVLIPNVSQFVQKIDLISGIFVTLIEGMIE